MEFGKLELLAASVGNIKQLCAQAFIKQISNREVGDHLCAVLIKETIPLKNQFDIFLFLIIDLVTNCSTQHVVEVIRKKQISYG